MNIEKEKFVVIDGPAGTLEALLSPPLPPCVTQKLAIICHPHPLFGGTMHNKVVHTAARACQELAIPSIRFNYRGVGNSRGQYDEGLGEADDLRAVIKWSKANYEFDQLILIGFSFGSFIATQVAFSDGCDFLITIAPAVSSHDYKKIMPITIPWLLIQGLADEIVPAQEVLAFAQAQNPKPTIEKFDAGHFFHGKLIELKGALVEHLAKMA